MAFEANEAREILRALRMAKELKLDPIVTGARQAQDVTADLKAQNARVIYSLNYPRRPRALAPDDDEPLSVLRDARRRAEGAGRAREGGRRRSRSRRPAWRTRRTSSRTRRRPSRPVWRKMPPSGR